TFAPGTRPFGYIPLFLASIAQVAFDVSGRFERLTANHAGTTWPCGRGSHAQRLHPDNSRIAEARNPRPRGLVVPKCSEISREEGKSMKSRVETRSEEHTSELQSTDHHIFHHQNK